jgi:hypothetical protein
VSGRCSSSRGSSTWACPDWGGVGRSTAAALGEQLRHLFVPSLLSVAELSSGMIHCARQQPVVASFLLGHVPYPDPLPALGDVHHVACLLQLIHPVAAGYWT